MIDEQTMVPGAYSDAQSLLAALMRETMFRVPKQEYTLFWRWVDGLPKGCSGDAQKELDAVIRAINFIDDKFPELHIAERVGS